MNHSTKTRPSSRRVRAASALLATGLGVGALAGCGNGVDAESGDAPTRTVSVTPTPSGSPSSASPSTSSGSSQGSTSTSSSGSTGGSSGSTGSSSSTGSSGSGICTAGDLKVTVEEPAGNGGGTAGSVYVLLAFENTSSSACVLDGHPGVSFVGKGSGTQLGRAADFVGPTKRTRIVSGGAARARLRITSPGPYGASCAPVTPDGFRVYPPDSRASVFVGNTSFRACSKKLPGGKSQLSVTAVGTAG